MTHTTTRKDAAGFSLIELLVVLVILGILGAIAIPRFLDQQQAARNATAVSDLRNLVSTQISLEATSGLSDDATVIADEGWVKSESEIVACAALSGGGSDITLTVWHLNGSFVYSWQRSVSQITSAEIAVPSDCTGLGNSVG